MKKNLLLIALTVLSLLLVSCGGNKEITVYPVQIGDHWGYVNEKGKYIVNPTFDSADYFSCGRARYSENGLFGYIDSKGRKVIEAVYSRATTFSEDKAYVVRDGEALECINTKGEVLFSLEGVEGAFSFHEGLSCIVDTCGKCGFINDKGDVIIGLKYYNAGDFHDGLAYVWNDDVSGFINKKEEVVFTKEPYEIFDYVSDLFSADYNEKMYELSCKMKEVVFTKYRYNIYDYFSDGYAVHRTQFEERYGYIDKKGIITIPFQFDKAKNFVEDLACVKIGGKYGYIDKKGNYVINPQYEYADSFSDGLAVVGKEGHFGYVDYKGKMVIQPTFSAAYDFVGGYAFVENGKNLYGIINKKGDLVVNPQFTNAKKPDIIDVVRSGKFYGKNFVPEFLKRLSNDGWDGLNGTTSLKSIRALYSKAKSLGDMYLICDTTFDPIDDVKLISMMFGFGEKTYKIVKNYSSFWGVAFEDGTKRQYFDELPLKTLQYSFELQGFASMKGKSVAEALANGISEVYGVEVLKGKNNYTLEATEKNPKTTLTWRDNKVSLMLDYRATAPEEDKK